MRYTIDLENERLPEQGQVVTSSQGTQFKVTLVEGSGCVRCNMLNTNIEFRGRHVAGTSQITIRKW